MALVYMFLSGSFPQCVSEKRRSYLRIFEASYVLIKKSWFFYGNHEDLLSCNELVLGQFGGAMRFHCVCLTSTVIFLLLHVILFNAKSVNGNQFGR